MEGNEETVMERRVEKERNSEMVGLWNRSER